MAARFGAMALGAVVAGGTAVSYVPHPVAGDIKNKAGTALYKNAAWPVISLMNPEQSHNFSVWLAKMGLTPIDRVADDAILQTTVLGKTFKNPLGLAAGCDKHGEAVRGFLEMGFGFVEVGSITPEPQEGNPKPRMFRLKEDDGVINRYGFNSDGSEVVKNRLTALRAEEAAIPGVLGINLGKNKTAEAIPDYTHGVKQFGALADYLVVNVSSPNTPGLRNLQGKKDLQVLMKAVMQTRDQTCPKVPVVVKIAPDVDDAGLQDICDVVVSTGVDGMIVSNTTNQRPESLQGEHKGETGGLSGLPVKDLSTEILRKTYVMTKGKVPLIGVGGVGTGQDAYDKIRAGAGLVQMYSRLAYEGPYAVPLIKTELAELLKRDGFSRLEDAVGVDAKAAMDAKPAKRGWF